MTRRGRYRWRTQLRAAAPSSIAERISKGRDDCGAHEWYRSDNSTWRCYHCRIGVTHVSPFSREEVVAGRLAALRLRFRALEGAPFTDVVAAEAHELLEEASALTGEQASRAVRPPAAPR